MRNNLQQLLSEKQISWFSNAGILLCPVKHVAEGIDVCNEVLNMLVDKKTVLYLSGGSTPKPLYESIVEEEKLRPGVVGLVDERYGEPLHDASNEKMIAQTGLLRYFSILDIPYYAMLRGDSIERTTERYDELIRSLQTVYPKSVGILGIGADGHTAGIAPNRSDFINPMFDKQRQYEMYSWFNDSNGQYKKRVTMTFLGLSMLDIAIVLVFGKEKKQALQMLFEDGPEGIVPARFYKREGMASKTVIITDQEV